MFKKCELVKLEELSGYGASIYSFYKDDNEYSNFEMFIMENENSFIGEVRDILSRLKTIGTKTGLRRGFYKENEGKPGDGVCALYDRPKSNLRLYFIQYGANLIILGGGGEKPKNIRALQEDEKLKSENYLLRLLSEKIKDKFAERELTFSDKGFEGDFIILNNQ